MARHVVAAESGAAVDRAGRQRRTGAGVKRAVLRELFHFSGDTLHIIGIGALAACCAMLFSAAVKPGMKPTGTGS